MALKIDPRVRILRGSQPDPETGCWNWIRRLDRGGYGRYPIRTPEGRRAQTGAHRASYAAFVGPIPEGMTVDHICFNPACVNPEHLQLLSPRQNFRRQRTTLRTHCDQGHEFTPENSIQGPRGRTFRTCRRKYDHERRRRPKAAVA